MRLKPLFDRVILEVTKEEDEKVGEIIIPKTVQSVKNIATVVAVGEGKLTEKGDLIKPSVKVGDKVMFDANRATPISNDDKNYLLISEVSILAVIE